MDLSSSRYSSKQPVETPATSEMSVMMQQPMRPQENVLRSPRSMPWNEVSPRDSRAIMVSSSRDQSTPRPMDRIELPSIRLAIPAIMEPLESERRELSNYSPSRGPAPIEASYVSSPASKRRKVSEDEGVETYHEASQKNYAVPRSMPSPRQSARHPNFRRSPPTPDHRSSSQYANNEYPSRRQSSPYMSNRAPALRTQPLPSFMGSMASGPYDPALEEFRPSLPSLPSFMARDRPQPARQPRTNSWSDYALDPARSRSTHSYPPPPGSQWESPGTSQGHYGQGFQYGYPPSRGSSYSDGRMVERSPFTPSPAYGSHDPHMYEMGMGGGSEGNKQRKRRGNLPKETTDKLRTWFHQHLQHPYPTEDEKQELMRVTGLQMNQISNWFINARRRQLPAIMNNARIETDARNTRGAGPTNPMISPDENSGSEGGYEEEDEARSSIYAQPSASSSQTTAGGVGGSTAAMPVSSMYTMIKPENL